MIDDPIEREPDERAEAVRAGMREAGYLPEEEYDYEEHASKAVFLVLGLLVLAFAVAIPLAAMLLFRGL